MLSEHGPREEDINFSSTEEIKDVKNDALTEVAFYLANENITTAGNLRIKNNLSEDYWQNPMIKQSLDDYTFKRINGWYTAELEKLRDNLAIPQSYFESPEIMHKVLDHMADYIQYGNHEMSRLSYILKMRAFFKPSTEQFKSALKEGIKKKTRSFFQPTEETLQQVNELKKPPFNLTYGDFLDAVGDTLEFQISRGYMNAANEIVSIYGVKKEFLQNPEIVEKAKQSVMNNIISRRSEYLSEYAEYKDIISPSEYKTEVVKGLDFVLQSESVDDIKSVIDVLERTPEKFSLAREESTNFLNKGLVILINKLDPYNAQATWKIKSAMFWMDAEKLPLDESVFQEGAEKIKELLIDGQYHSQYAAMNLGRDMKIPAAYFDVPEIKQVLQEALIKEIRFGKPEEVVKFIEAFSLSNDEVESIIIDSYTYGGDEFKFDKVVETIKNLGAPVNLDLYINRALEIGDVFSIINFVKSDNEHGSKEKLVEPLPKNFPAYVKQICDVWGVVSYGELAEFSKHESDFLSYLSYYKKEVLITREDLEYVNKLRINNIEANKIKELNSDNKDILMQINQSDNVGESTYKELLAADPDNWDDFNTGMQMEDAGKIFGYERMFEYIGRTGLSRHDGLHAFSKIIELHKASGLTPDQFYGQILKQVNLDSQYYDEGTAHHHLNSLAGTLDGDFASVIEKAKNFIDIKQLQELIKSFNSAKDIFSSWNSLKRYSELSNLLERSELLEDLKDLKHQGKDKLYDYVETLAFHPDSKVDQKEVMRFWREPDHFLKNSDSHTPSEVHNKKKPSNYTDIPYLDLSGAELRDAVVEGTLDKLQVFKPLEITYHLSKENTLKRSTREVTLEALGSRRNNIKGKAKNPSKLFNELDRTLKLFNLTVQDYLGGSELPEGAEDQVAGLIHSSKFGMEAVKEQSVEFIAKINNKSDPHAVMAGNDTACCMPFGSGKNNIYTFNPDTSLFTIQIKKGDGNFRTIAQSVITKDKDIKKDISEIVAIMQGNETHLSEILSEDVLKEAPTYLSCDNIEVNPNYTSEVYQSQIATIYEDFFKEYMNRYATDEGLNPDKVPIGKGYTDAMTSLPIEKNTYAPLAPVGYSDKTSGEVYMLDLKNSNLRLNKNVSVNDGPESAAEIPLETRGVGYLTFQDTLPVAYLEGKIYADNESLIVNLHNIENALIAKDINNVAKGRSNMSLKYTDTQGNMKGYMLAYEGQNENKDSTLYISDLAVDSSNVAAGGRLIKGFVELYRKNYLDKDNLIPIFAQARETTSFKIIKKQLDRIGEELHIEFELEEQATYQSGNDTMHPVVIKPRTKQKTS